MQRFLFITGALLAGLAVAMGAATGHETSSFSGSAQIWIAKAIRYQFYHALAMISVALSLIVVPGQHGLLGIAGCCFLGGIICFSGSLYYMAFWEGSAGYITPLGGLLFLAGWLALVAAGLKMQRPN